MINSFPFQETPLDSIKETHCCSGCGEGEAIVQYYGELWVVFPVGGKTRDFHVPM